MLSKKGVGLAIEKNRFHVLDLLRFFAAISVLLYHYSVYFKDTHSIFIAPLKYGYLGVVFFFMLSGFVISLSANNSTPFKFAFARAKRLYPAFIACLAITLLVAYVFKGQVWPLKNILLNGLIINDYFRVANIDGVYWTLQAELKFYGCIFLLIAVKQFKQHKVWLPLWLLMACVHYFTNQPFFMGWFINPAYSFYFMGGVSALLLYKDPQSLSLKIYFLISSVFGVMSAGDQVHDFIIAASALDVIVARVIVCLFYAFFFMLSLGKYNFQKVSWWWAYLGAMSYPLYLLHNYCGKTLIDHFNGSLPLALLVPVVGCVVLCFALAVHLVVEKPIAKLKLA